MGVGWGMCGRHGMGSVHFRVSFSKETVVYVSCLSRIRGKCSIQGIKRKFLEVGVARKIIIRLADGMGIRFFFSFIRLTTSRNAALCPKILL